MKVNMSVKRNQVLKYVLILALLLSALMAGCSPACDSQSCTRVLFIGNSYTYVNDLPSVFAELAKAGGHPVETGMAAESGLRLVDHELSAKTQSAIKSAQWTYVVLQEQSEIPSMPFSRDGTMYPSARSLAKTIQSIGATPLFFMTWAHRDGWPENGLPNYESMQYAIDKSYLGIAYELKAPVAPVGSAWMTATRLYPQLALWQADGSHTSEQGTYLAACVFYAAIFRESPAGLSYRANLPGDIAEQLQKIAGETVLTNPSQWNLR
jgi:hypothetical protein